MIRVTRRLEIFSSEEKEDNMTKQLIGVALALAALTVTISAQECYICPGGSLRDYWILQMEAALRKKKFSPFLHVMDAKS